MLIYIFYVFCEGLPSPPFAVDEFVVRLV